jgi:hypothetical protein
MGMYHSPRYNYLLRTRQEKKVLLTLILVQAGHLTWDSRKWVVTYHGVPLPSINLKVNELIKHNLAVIDPDGPTISITRIGEYCLSAFYTVRGRVYITKHVDAMLGSALETK